MVGKIILKFQINLSLFYFAFKILLLGIASAAYTTYYGHLEFLLFEENVEGAMVLKGSVPVNFWTFFRIYIYTGSIFTNINIPFSTVNVLESQVRWKFQFGQITGIYYERVPFDVGYYNVKIYEDQYALVDSFKDVLDKEFKSKGVPLRFPLAFWLQQSNMGADQRTTDGVLLIKYKFPTSEGKGLFSICFF